jgi:DNA helicase-2/ATP-dependent DNA helicase PcrA
MDSPMDPILDPLNEEQRRAVTHRGGPLLILAGAGSGKTRVLTHRVAWLIRESLARPDRILAVTFTNKAAREMRGRLTRLLGVDPGRQGLWVGTFHATCARMLRRDGPIVGLDRAFAVFDETDQRSVIRQAMSELGFAERDFPPAGVAHFISTAKNELLDAAGQARAARHRHELVASKVRERYDQLLRENNAVDFDDLLLYGVILLEQPGARERWQDRFAHVLVDEFQDTNRAQYVFVRHLADVHRQLAVVGDDDQSIYSWRGANIRNILDFERDWPEATVVKLERNYRSTQAILDAAHAVVSNNVGRMAKKLWTDQAGGTPLLVYEASNEYEEADFVVREVERLMREDSSLSLSDVAVLYRTNAQSRAIEEVLLRYGMPYQVVGGIRFYERREVKDVLAYLRLMENLHDQVALTRVINVPPRGLGARTQEELQRWSRANDLRPVEALARAEEIPAIGKRQQQELVSFGRMLESLRKKVGLVPLPDLIDGIIDAVGLERYFRDQTEEGEERWANVLELRRIAEEYVDLPLNEQLQRFLEQVALVADVDTYREGAPAVTLITLHAVKGLEFPVVFLTGLEEGVFPHVRSMDTEEELEEERRLCYVGLTRAKQRCYLSYAVSRTLFGRGAGAAPSRFLLELPLDQIDRRGAPHLERDPWGELGEPEDHEAMARRREARAARALAGLSRAWRGSGNGSSPAERVVAEAEYRAGDKVRHPAFGEGIVVSSAPRDNDEEVTVAFAGQGVKKLMASFARLERVP